MLAEMPLLQQPDSRQLLVQKLRERLTGGSTLHDINNPRMQSMEIVGACLSGDGQLGTLLQVLALFDPAAAQLTRLERLHCELGAIGLLTSTDWAELRAPLSANRPRSLGRLYQSASSHQLAMAPHWCVSAWDVFIYLTGQNAPPRGLPPNMLFLALLEPEVDAEVGSLIRSRNQREATRLGLTPDLDRRRREVNAGGGSATPFVYLVIQVEPDLEPGSTGYTVSHYRQWHGAETWHSRLWGQVPGVPYTGLEETVEGIIRQMEVEWSHRRAEVAVELVLPVALLNEDVAWWRKERASAYLPQKVLAMDYPVVVRSLDRLRQPEWHRAWRLRWNRMQAEPAHSRVYRSEPDGEAYLTRLEADLNADPRWTTLLLSEPPTPVNDWGLSEMMTALRAGLPAVVWHRERPSDDRFWEEIQGMTADGKVARLPVHARHSRLDALRLAPPHLDDHAGRHLVVLWDDPDRTPELRQPVDTLGGEA
ncbi:hypothetical protein JD76_02056 [Micromonospora endolithica]|nr:hypothetical protein JD76_02056 [Micromonospora endolithica]